MKKEKVDFNVRFRRGPQEVLTWDRLEERSWREVIAKFRSRAHDRGLEVDLTANQVKELMETKCAYCLADPCLETKPVGHVTVVRSTIDRIDSAKGYVTDNVLPCCLYCNRAKGDRSRKEYEEWLHGALQRLVFAPLA